MASTNAAQNPEELVRRVGTRSREAARLGREFGRATRGTVDDLALATRLQLERSPYATLGATFGLGYVLGGGLPLKLIAVAAAIGGRLAVSVALREVARRAFTGAEDSSPRDGRSPRTGPPAASDLDDPEMA